MNEYRHLKKVVRLKTKHLNQVSKLRWRLSGIAITKAEETITERMEASNNKFALLKEQTATFPTRVELNTSIEALNRRMETQDKAIANLSRIVYIGLGVVLVLQFLIPYLLK